MANWEYAQMTFSTSSMSSNRSENTAYWVWPDGTTSTEEVSKPAEVCTLLNAAGADGWELAGATSLEMVYEMATSRPMGI
jgi:hypothetical protein